MPEFTQAEIYWFKSTLSKIANSLERLANAAEKPCSGDDLNAVLKEAMQLNIQHAKAHLGIQEPEVAEKKH